MKNQKYQVVIEDLLPNNQVIKLWDSIGLEVLLPSQEASYVISGKKREISSGFSWRNGILTFHGDANLSISTKDLEKQYHKLQSQKQSIKKQPFARALGLKNRNEGDWVLDGTMGMGKDYLLASLFGFDVVGVEKSNLCLALVGTFLFTAKESISSSFCFLDTTKMLEDFCINPERKNIFKVKDPRFFSTSQLQKNNGFLVGEKKISSPSVIFLDPMYDEMNETALPSKTMQILRCELEPTKIDDFNALFLVSMQAVQNRVVIKRSIKSDVKFKEYFSYSCFGKSTRYDVYLKA